MDMKTVIDSIAANKVAFARAVQTIRANKQLTPDGRRQQITRVFAAASAKHKALVQQYQADIQSERERLARLAFWPSSQRPDDVQNLRDAVRTAQGGDLRKLIQRAKLTHDTTLAKAIAAVAIETDDWATIDAAAGIDPDIAALVRHEEDYGMRRSLQRELSDSIRLSDPERPAEVVDQAGAAV
jgi:hypothetical protein